MAVSSSTLFSQHPISYDILSNPSPKHRALDSYCYAWFKPLKFSTWTPNVAFCLHLSHSSEVYISIISVKHKFHSLILCWSPRTDREIERVLSMDFVSFGLGPSLPTSLALNVPSHYPHSPIAMVTHAVLMSGMLFPFCLLAKN